MEQELYHVKNVVRRVNTRLRRTITPGRQRFKQYVCGRRLLRGQVLTINEAQFDAHEKQLLEMVSRGVIEVLMPDGEVMFADSHGTVKVRTGTVVEDYRRIPQSKPQEEPPAAEEPVEKPAPAPESKPDEEPVEVEYKADADDLTQLPHIASGRAKRLKSHGITTFRQVADLSVEQLQEMLSLNSIDQAHEIKYAAGEKSGGAA